MTLTDRRFDSIAALGLGLVAVLLHLPILSYGTVEYDTQSILLQQPELFDTPSFLDGLRAIFNRLPREEPLLFRDLSWLIDSWLFGFGNPVGPHLGNLLLHAATCALIVPLWRRIGVTPEVALVAGVLFAVHPIHVEPVAWVMGRKDVLSTFLGLASLMAWVMARRPSSTTRQLGWLGLALAALALGMLSKINLVTFPAVWGAASLLVPRSTTTVGNSTNANESLAPRRPRPLELVGLGAGLVVAGGIFAWYRSQVLAWGLLGRGLPLSDPMHLRQLITLIPEQVGTFAVHFLWPWDYGIFYDAPAVGMPTDSGRVVLGGLIMAGFAVGAVAGARVRPLVSFALLGVALTILPYLNIVYIGIIVANRYLYLPSVFLTLLVAEAAVGIYRWRPAGRAVVVAVGVAWAPVAAWQHTRWLPAWSSDDALWAYEAMRTEPSLLGLQGRTKSLVRQAESLDPRDPVQAETRHALLEQAMATVASGYELYESYGVVHVDGYVNYQRAYLAKLTQWEGRILEAAGAPIEKAIEAYERALALAPFHRLPLFMLARSRAQAAAQASDPVTAEAHAARSLDALRRYAALVRTESDVRRVLRIADGLARRFESLRAELDALTEELHARRLMY